jgi:hypothetical protein
MAVQDILLFSLAPAAPAHLATFADPEWRGATGDGDDRLRPLIHIDLQVARLSAWIAAGGDYGWLGEYQARRAAFELQSIRAQISHETARHGGRLADSDRLAVQSRLDRLQTCLEIARTKIS